MALNAYLKIKGQKQGIIKGSVTQKGREGLIKVIAVSHEIVSPRDAASGLPTGKRMHKPLVITKEIDKSSPLLISALVNNENITSFTLDMYQPSMTAAGSTGQETNFYRIELVNANIASVDTRMANNANPELAKYAPYEEISFVYQKITWTYLDGGITASDDWQSPIV
jgi:type VI secretion system secreted protein Hcp